MTDWRAEFFEIEDVVYLNAAAQGIMPRTAIRAVQQALEWKKFPHHMPDDVYFTLPDRVRGSFARLIGAQPEEVAVTTGASGGMAAVAAGFAWEPGDEVLLAEGEFPLHFATFLPLAEAGKLRVRMVKPRGRFLCADDFVEAMGPHTRLVSASLVRFDTGVRLDAPRLARACHQGRALLLLDAAQCAGAVPLDVRTLGADFLAVSGYKWLLGPYGTGFLWVRDDLIERLGPRPFYWLAFEDAADFPALAAGGFRRRRGARRWDAPETASFFNLAGLDASLEFLLRVGVEAIWQHNNRLLAELIARLPLDRCVLVSPANAENRGPYVCVSARNKERTAELFERLSRERVIVSLREGGLRIAPHLYNSERDIDRLLAILTA